jgi:hypothetical protein
MDPLGALLNAVKTNELETVRTLLARDTTGRLVNGDDDDGRTPLFFANTPEMLQLLLLNGAVLSGAVDVDGRNPLHFLFTDTFPRLVERAPREWESIHRRAMKLAYMLMRAHIENGTPIELQTDGNGLRPVDYLDNPRQWPDEFIERLNHLIVDYTPPPVGGREGKIRRKNEILRKLCAPPGRLWLAE